MNEQQFQFEWDEAKAEANLRKHGVSFEMASSLFADPQILTLADTTHSEWEDRWFSVGLASNGVPMPVAYLWTDKGAAQSRFDSLVLVAQRRPRFATTQKTNDQSTHG